MSALTPVPGSLRAIFMDTTIAVAFFRQDQAVRQRLMAVDIVTSTIVTGELYYGAYRAGYQARELANIAALIAHSRIVVCDLLTSEHYGRIRDALHRQGTPIPENDIWIAASAVQHGLPLATRDAHFDRVPGLIVEQW
ncbi:MAG: type II toxin-antitoxin system VapC family toxin [Chloroflexota bacterium]|nr:type II toxin-antitoxin system VapC family toxin [Chloroflexota bacterium]